MVEMAELQVGDVFAGRYQVRGFLGEGDRKRTYLAHDVKMDGLVALSLIKPEAALADPEGTAREARVLRRIGSNPNIVSVYDYGIDQEGSLQYIVFQYLSGGTLTEYLRTAGQLPLEEILRLGRQLCRGLSHLHKHRLIHRDVSPDNVWLDEHHAAHLGDFDSAITITGAGDLLPITTNSFAAPEEREGRSLDPRADLFSLGGMLYVAATGNPQPGDLGLLRTSRPDLPSSFKDLVASLLSASPDDRPADTESVLRWLDEVRHASNIDALIIAGESDKVEFKASLYYRHGPLPQKLEQQVVLKVISSQQAEKEVQKHLRAEVTQTIAAFLNTGGGTLLIGVSDSGTVVGIEPDFKHFSKEKQDRDHWLLSLKDVIVKALGPEIWGALQVSLVRHGPGTVAVVHCPARASETWHREDGHERFYVRTANATHELTGPSLVRYVREHWIA